MRVSHLFDYLRSRIPLKARDETRSKEIWARKRAPFAHLGTRAARRDSFRAYWRDAVPYPPTKGTRRERRARALHDWRLARRAQ